MTTLTETIRDQFRNLYNRVPECLVQAPGRINLIGEHTDYNDGFVLPCAINYRTVIASAKRPDRQVRIYTSNFQKHDHFFLDRPIQKNHTQTWTNYVRGVFAILLEKYPEFLGCDLLVHSNIPLGAGLSSSASLEVSIATTLKTLYDLPISSQNLARLCQQAENRFAGCQCGIMDQLISTLGEKDHALLIDCRNLETRSIPIPPGLSIMIINSNVQHGLVNSEYNLRRQQCEEASRILRVPTLRDATAEQLESCKQQMPLTVYKRARHVVTENTRTLQAAKALSDHDLQTISQLLYASHQSMKDDFEITVPPIDFLVDLIKRESDGQVGARMTGGGFGGCVIALVPDDQVRKIRNSITKNYFPQTGLQENIHICHASQGAGALSL